MLSVDQFKYKKFRLEFSELEIDPNENAVVSSATNKSQTSFHSEYLFKTPRYTRHKRQADQYEYTPTKTRCPLLLVADYRFFQEMGSGNTKTTINYLVSVNSIANRLKKIECSVTVLFVPLIYR